jgi:hypothetical protein
VTRFGRVTAVRQMVVLAVHQMGVLPVQGSAFYPLQSCLNHDNDPNCSCQKDVDDRDGCAVLTALRPIAQGAPVLTAPELTVQCSRHCDSSHEVCLC